MGCWRMFAGGALPPAICELGNSIVFEKPVVSSRKCSSLVSSVLSAFPNTSSSAPTLWFACLFAASPSPTVVPSSFSF